MKLENIYDEIIEIEQKTVYAEVDGTERVFTAKGDADSIEIFMPEAEKIDIQYATDSIKDLKYRKVIVGIVSEEGVLFVPEDAMKLARDYLYSLSIVNGDTHVILDWNTVDGIAMMKGDVALYVHEATPEDLTNAQKRTIGDRLALSVVILVDGEYVTQLGGHADIYERTENTMVYYVDPDGKASLIESDHKDGITHIRVSHFSIYMYTNSEVSEELPIFWMALISIAIVLILILVFVWRRKQKA
ncbi:MAG: hypothetical protein IKN41_00645 [Candidatus Methanomethylophilaceae archaeon]|nr:hypothetical protein [Candidatus Methanomethylophilaceae archaeon]MBR6910349.1 hypothetical protein [Candidatus Methanomethylophilaceae archaeon]